MVSLFWVSWTLNTLLPSKCFKPPLYVVNKGALNSVKEIFVYARPWATPYFWIQALGTSTRRNVYFLMSKQTFFATGYQYALLTVKLGKFPLSMFPLLYDPVRRELAFRLGIITIITVIVIRAYRKLRWQPYFSLGVCAFAKCVHFHVEICAQHFPGSRVLR